MFNITMGQLGEGLAETVESMSKEANKLLQAHQEAEDKGQKVVPATKKRAEEFQQVVERVGKQNKHGEPSNDYILSQVDYDKALKVFQEAYAKGTKEAHQLVVDLGSIVAFMFGKDNAAKFFNPDNGKSTGAGYKPNVETTVVKAPNELLVGWHDHWNRDRKALLEENPDDPELREMMPKYKDLPLGNGVTPKKCIFCNLDTNCKCPFYKSMNLKKRLRCESKEHRIVEGLMTFQKHHNFTILQLAQLFPGFLHQDFDGLPSKCSMCRYKYTKDKKGNVWKSMQNHLESDFHQYMIRTDRRHWSSRLDEHQ